MEQIRNLQNGDFSLEGEAYFHLFERWVGVFARTGADREYCLLCVQYLNSLSEAIIDELCEGSIRYCNEFLYAIGKEQSVFSDKRDILSLCQPRTIIVPTPKNSTEPVAHLEFSCEWEEEHGMEWLVRGDRVLYVGPFEDADEWVEFPEQVL